MRGYVEAKFLKDFTFQANLAVDNTWAMRYRYISKLHGAGVSEKGAFGRSYTDYQNINSQQTLNWAHDYGKHHVDALIGHEFNWMRTSSLNYKAAYSLIEGFDTFANYIFPNSGGTFSGIGGGEDQEALEGYFLRANYNYDNKYYVTGSVRADGSSKFRYNDDRWGVFWSVGGAWRISAEPWAAADRPETSCRLRCDRQPERHRPLFGLPNMELLCNRLYHSGQLQPGRLETLSKWLHDPVDLGKEKNCRRRS